MPSYSGRRPFIPADPLPALHSPDTIRVEVCAAWPDRALRQELCVPVGTTPQALRRFPGLDPQLQTAWDEASAVGVYGEPKALREALRDGDRLELWRPLMADPKEARRQRARLKGVDAAAPRRRKDNG
ncbi:MAG: RnfH family protein [Burkholderiaceae bacterium]|nr:RnfH family protein [Burkholderiaceae bacterium]